MTKTLIISIDELWLKGRNKKIYFKAVMSHINSIFRAYHAEKVTIKSQGQRIYCESETFFEMELIDALTLIPGLSSVTPAKIIPLDKDLNLENMYAEILNETKFFLTESKTFRACVKKNHPKVAGTSVDIEREIGHRIISQYPNAKVSLVNFDIKVEARIYGHYIAISTISYKGVGGLPWGSSGHGLTMLSGGFDSPVASYMITRRGVKSDFIFFHAYPFVGREVLEKIKKLASRLAQFQKQSHLYVVPFGEIQTQISENCQEEYKTILFRKAMVEVSNLVCDRIGAECLVTGDSLGQVSSQTIGNMHLMDRASERMILRPLVGNNKLEIIAIAKQIKTHDLSNVPHDDACALFAPKNPIINPNYDYWNKVDLKEILKDQYATILDKIQSYSINIKGELFKKDFLSYDHQSRD